MKNKFLFLSAIISSCVLNLGFAQQQPPVQQGPRACYPSSKCTGDPNLIGRDVRMAQMPSAPGMQQQAPRGLQTESMERLVGTVKSVDRVQLPDHTQVQLVLTSDRGDVLVIVGPANFVDQARVKMQAGDKITINGFRISGNGQQVFVAANIQKDGATLEILDSNRQPVWMRGGPGMQFQGQPGQPGQQPGQAMQFQGQPGQPGQQPGQAMQFQGQPGQPGQPVQGMQYSGQAQQMPSGQQPAMAPTQQQPRAY